MTDEIKPSIEKLEDKIEDIFQKVKQMNKAGKRKTTQSIQEVQKPIKNRKGGRKL